MALTRRGFMGALAATTALVSSGLSVLFPSKPKGIALVFGDGAHDDTAAIQHAIDGGDTYHYYNGEPLRKKSAVYFPSGMYNVSSLDFSKE